jgi:diguanylate cyclase (GGDEF)-like protein/PAS domain S-box-containing protein
VSYTRLAGHDRPDYAGTAARCAITAGEEAPAAAREFLRSVLPDTPEELSGRALQIVTELVTNSVKHSGGSTVVVEAWPNPQGGFDIQVSDDGPGFDVSPRVAGHDDPEGWGLLVVDMLSDVWGSGGPGDPYVWARLEPRAIDEDGSPAVGPALEGQVRDLLDVRMLLDSVRDYAIFALDTTGVITLWNAGAERLTGYAADEALGKSMGFLHEGSVPADDLATALAHGRNEFERWMQRKDGSRFWADSVLTPIFDSTGMLRGFSSVSRDVTWRKRLDEDRDGLIARIGQLARTDELTGLANRRRWHEELDRELARARRQHGSVCVAMVDMDGFKAINDEQGHLAGDVLLQQTSVAWAGALRTTDTLARYGGDEFSVILPDCPLDEACTVIERLRAATPAPVTCSAGVACSDGAESAETLVRRADAALYEAKRAGRNATTTR